VIRVALAVTPPMLREILAELLHAQDDIVLVEGPDGPARDAGAPAPDVLIVSAPEGAQGRVARDVLRRFPACKVLTLAGEACDASLHELRPHARPLGELSPPRLLQIIRRVAAHPAPP
jgi:DNA-binding NarL/FixJ family response regulator